MLEATYEATVINGHICLPTSVQLPENSKVLVTVPGTNEMGPGHIASPRLADPEQAIRFTMDVREIGDAGV